MPRTLKTPFGNRKQLAALLSRNNAVKSTNTLKFNNVLTFYFSPRISRSIKEQVYDVTINDLIDSIDSGLPASLFYNGLHIRNIHYDYLPPNVFRFIEHKHVLYMSDILHLLSLLQNEKYYIDPLIMDNVLPFMKIINTIPSELKKDSNFIQRSLKDVSALKGARTRISSNFLKSYYKKMELKETISKFYKKNFFIFDRLSGNHKPMIVSRKARTI